MDTVAFAAPAGVHARSAFGAKPMAVGVRPAALGRNTPAPVAASVSMNVSRRAVLSAAAAAAMVIPAVAVSSDRPMLAAVAATAAAPVAVAATSVPGTRAKDGSAIAAPSASSATAVKAAPPPPPAEPELVTPPARRVAWGYVGEGSADNWGKINPEFAACSNVGTQSPVALSYRNAVTVADQAAKPTLTVNPARFICKRREAGPGAANPFFFFDVYKPATPSSDAPSDAAAAGPAASLHVPNVGDFDLLGFHFHCPTSEHILETSRSVMEVHFVFGKRKVVAPPPPATIEEAQAAAVEEGAPAFFASVLGILFEEGPKTPPFLRQVLSVATPKGQSPQDFPEAGRLVDFDLRDFIPSLDQVDLFSYSGSLTTPPGTEGVLWWVVSERAKVTSADAARLTRAQGGPNSRPIQALGTRRVMRYSRNA